MGSEKKREEKKEKKILFQDGKIYFSRSSERLFFLIMTVLMAAIGLICDGPFI